MPALASPSTRRSKRSFDPEHAAVAAARAFGRERLAGLSDTPGLDTDVLLEHAAGLSRVEQITRSDVLLEPDAAGRFVAAIERRAAGEPVAYITGVKVFRSIELRVDDRVLVPRPETELLVEVGLTALNAMRGALRVVDVGTGSGAVALALAKEMPTELAARAEVIGCDISQQALEAARLNRDALGLTSRVVLVASDLLERLPHPFDLILANLPYLRPDQRHPSTAGEPDLALYAGDDGLDAYRRLLPQAGELLTEGGVIACEIDPSQAGEMKDLMRGHIPGYAAVLRDLAGRERIVVAGAVDIVRTVIDTWPYGA